ncbi:MAG: NTP transferase domain-containing protein [Candidatus Aminicenantes bacterium]|nr:NTP transferase domain-containing protein [Candidatus Aminicenantes bacterium]
MDRKTAVIILAGGKGTRMHSKKNKLLHKILGRELIRFPVEAAENVEAEKIILVVGPHNQKEIKSLLRDRVDYVLQKEALGTAHAVWQAEPLLEGFTGETFVIVGDSPYISGEILKKLLNFHRENKAALTLISSVFENPPAYGRIIKDEKGFVKKVVEEIDASEEEKKIKEVNSSYYCFTWEKIAPLLHKIDINQKKGEYYLTDIVEIAYNAGLKTLALKIDDPLLTKGINSRADLSEAAKYFSMKNINALEETGVTFFGKETITVEFNVRIGKDTVIHPCTYLGENTEIGKNCEIGPFVYLKNAKIPSGTKLSYAKIEGGHEYEG